MKKIPFFVAFLTYFFIAKIYSQDCYKVLESHSGFSDLYEIELQSKACLLQEKILEDDETNSFFIAGADLYPPITFVNELEGFEFIFNDIFQHRVITHSSYLFLVKQFNKDGDIQIKLELQLPDSGIYQQLTAIDRAAIKGFLFDIIEDELIEPFPSPYQIQRVEIKVIEALINLVQDLIDENFDMGPEILELAGFELVNFGEEEVVITADGNISFLENRVFDYAGLLNEDEGEYLRIKAAEEIVNSTFDINLIFSANSPFVPVENLSLAEEKYNSNAGDFDFWMHLSENGKLYYKVKANITQQEAESIIDYEYHEYLSEYLQEDTGTAVKPGDSPSHKNAGPDCSMVECSPKLSIKWAKQWSGKCCLLNSCDEILDSPVNPGAPMVCGMGIGLMDGLLQTLFFIYDVGTGLKEAVDHTPLSTSWWSDAFYRAAKEGSFRKGFASKIEDDRQYWKELKSNLDALVSAINFPLIKMAIIQGIMDYMNLLNPYEGGIKTTGYAIGKIAFEVILAYFTGGTGNLAKVSKFSKPVFDKLKTLKLPSDFRILVRDGLYGSKATLSQLKCKILYAGCFVAGTTVLGAGGATPIEQLNLGNWVYANKVVVQNSPLIASLEDEFEEEYFDPWVSEEQRRVDGHELIYDEWYRVGLEMKEDNGRISQVKLIRPRAWLDTHQIDLDHTVVWISMPEQGLEGYATVTSLAHYRFTKIPENSDEEVSDDLALQPITGIFIHESGDVWKLVFENLDRRVIDTLGVTSAHPIYSLDSQDWRLAGGLKIGERVLTQLGEARLVNKEKEKGVHRVYNLEVRELHNFLVGESGVVVHNNYNSVINKVKKLNLEKLKQHIQDGWDLVIKSKEDVVPFFSQRRYFQELMEEFRYAKEGLKSTGEITDNFKALDAFKEVSRKKIGNITEITADLAVSMKTTKVGDVTKWLNSKNIKHLDDLVMGLSEGITWKGHNIKFPIIRLDIYIPANIYTLDLAQDWKNYLNLYENSKYKDINLNISTIEKYLID